MRPESRAVARVRAVDAPGGERAQIRERAAEARRTSAALAERVRTVAAVTVEVRERVGSERSRWQAWRTAAAAVRARPDGGPSGWTPPPICPECGALRAVGKAPETWIEAPSWVRSRVVAEGKLPGFARERCPRCRRPAGAAAEQVTAVLADLEAAAAEAAARMPWLDEEAALAHVLDTVLARSGRTLGPAELDELAAGLHELTRHLRAGRAGRTGPGVGRLRPPLGKR
jgi:hypothetical protein